MSVTAIPGTLMGPQNITDNPGVGSGATTIAVSWPAVSGDNGSYQVLWYRRLAHFTVTVPTCACSSVLPEASCTSPSMV